MAIICTFFLASSCGGGGSSQSTDNNEGSGGASSGISWLSVSGDKTINEKGEEIRLRGIQIDFGSARGDLDFIDDSDSDQNIFFDNTIDYVITEEDFANIKSMGANSVRLSLNTYKDFENESAPFTYKENNFEKLDKMIEWAEKYSLYVTISMRQSPGGHNLSPHSGNFGLNQLWVNDDYQKRLIGLWEKIALRYINRSIVVGFDLLNEPEAPDRGSFNNVLNRLTEAIRKVDKNHIIFLEGNSWGKNLDWIDIPSDKNTALSIHFYEPGSYAVNGEGAYPSLIDGQDFNKEALRTKLTQRISYAKELNRPVWVGEFGAVTKAVNYLEYDKDIIDLFEEQSLNWNYWNYKNIKGVPDTQAVYYTTTDNKFLQIISKMSEGEKLSSFPESEISLALESLKTSNFFVKQELKELLINSFNFSKP